MKKIAVRLRVATNLTSRIAEIPQESPLSIAMASRATALLTESIDEIGKFYGEACGTLGKCSGKAQCRL